VAAAGPSRHGLGLTSTRYKRKSFLNSKSNPKEIVHV
jgi:hypothetical protein